MRMSHRRALFAQGGIPPVPTAWATYAVVDSTGSWSPTAAGWYQFYVIGKGGDGGSGDYLFKTSSLLINRAAGGGGGGTGGVAVHQLYLTPSDRVSITVSDSQTTLSYDGQTVTAIAGENGGDANAPDYYAGAGGSGGTATGGNIANLSGVQGETGGFINSGSNASPLTAKGGGGGTPTETMKYVASAPTPTLVGVGADAPYSTSVSSPQLGGGASGGGARSKSSRYSGGAGAAGGVVIEVGA